MTPLLVALLLGASAQSTGSMSPTSDVSGNRVRATGATTSRALRDRFADVVNVKDFGAIPNDGVDDAPAFRAAINYARSTAVEEIVIPSGDYNIDSSLDVSGFANLGSHGLTFRGQGRARIYSAAAGKVVFDCAGSGYISFENLKIIGIEASAPQAAILFSRVVGNGSAGWHTLRHVLIDGFWTKATVVSISSEVNNYFDSTFYNRRLGGAIFAVVAQNDLSVTSDFSTFPETFAGGNTVHRFIGCLFNMPIAYNAGSRGVILNDVSDVSFIGSFFSGSGSAGIDIGGAGVFQLQMVGTRAEWGGIAATTYGVLVRAGATLSLADFSGYWFDGGIYGEDGSAIRDCRFVGRPEELLASGYAFDVYDLEGSTVDTLGLGVRVRNRAFGNTFSGALMADASVTLATTALSGGNYVTPAPITGGDLVSRTWMSIGSEPSSRLRTNIIKPKMIQVVEQAATSTTSFTPDLSSGATVSLTMTDNLTINEPTGAAYAPAVTGEGYGAELTFILKQDGTGGRVVSWHSSYSILDGWQPSPSAGAVATIRFVLSSATGKWTQIAGAHAPLRGTLTADIDPIAAGSCTDSGVTVTWAAPGAECVVGLPETIPAGLLANCYVPAVSYAQLRLCNVTSSPINPPSLTYVIRVLNP